jgi:splicing factor 3B subunit 2
LLPFQLPDFIVKTGITEIRDTVAEDEAKLSAKQKNRGRVAPKMGAMDVDYKTLHEAFFKHQTKPTDLTRFGDLYYEGKEMETSTDRKPGNFSKELREALGMLSETSPPPWLINMQRYGSPPSYPDLAIPGLNAPLPNDQCQYGYHAGGWGKVLVDISAQTFVSNSV